MANAASLRNPTKTRFTSTSFLLFLIVVIVYVANGRSVGAGDTLPTRYLPFSLLRAHTFHLDGFPILYGEYALRVFPIQDGIPYYLRYRDGHYLSAYSPGPAVLALPLYVLPVLAGVPADSWAAALEKLSSAAITALSVVFLFWALREVVSRRWALGIAAIYAFGTSSWSVSSQALWQHGPSQLFLALLVFCLARGLREERFLVYAGFAAAAATVMRSTDLLIALAVAAGVIYTHPRMILRFSLCALPPIAALLLYNLTHFGSLVGGSGNSSSPIWALLAQVPLVHGLAGVLFSPGRGLFVYSPVLLFSLAGLVRVGLHGPTLFNALAAGMIVLVLVVGKWFVWWGGHSWGPRLLADIAPILCFFLYPLADFLDRSRLMKGVFALVVVLSIGVHGLGAFFYDGRWDAQADIGRSDSPLWSWRESPLVFYSRRALSVIRPVRPGATTGAVTSADSPGLLAASYNVTPVASEAIAGESLAVSVEAKNTGRAVWLAPVSPVAGVGERGAVGLGWRWSRDNAEVSGGRVYLSSDVFPGQVARFTSRIPCPEVSGDYTLTIDLVSERVTWFSSQGQKAVSFPIRVRALDLKRFLSEPVRATRSAPTVTISTDQASYRRGETLRLTVEGRNPYYPPGKFDVYLLREGNGGESFYDGHQPPWPAEKGWLAVTRQLPMPAVVTGRFAVPISDLAPGLYRWYVIVTDAETYRQLAKATVAFRVEP